MKAKIIPLYSVSKVTTSSPEPKEHQHHCPLCGEIRMETNEVCGLSIDHVFACLLCIEDHLSRLKLDMEVILDICLD
jgi:formylmethanofuran dehydrogenase subunit E